jgi:hypothetical protein
MNEFTGKNEQAFLDACETIGVEPNAMVKMQKGCCSLTSFPAIRKVATS